MIPPVRAIEQQRITGSGELRRWTLDLEAIRARIGWASGAGAERLVAEASELAEHFPTWTAALGRPGPGDYWETGELVGHDPCGAPWVFDRGVRCADCGEEHGPPGAPGGAARSAGGRGAGPGAGGGGASTSALGVLAAAASRAAGAAAPPMPAGGVRTGPAARAMAVAAAAVAGAGAGFGARRVEPDEDGDAEGTPLLAFVGRIPAMVDDRPLLRKVRDHLAALRRAGLGERANLHRSYFIKAEGRTFFAPPVFAFFPSGWPRTDPLVMVQPDYFAVLDIPPSHVYPGTSYRLCNYAQWRDVTLRTVLQQRIVPRVLIDVMLADLKAMGCLEDALEEAGVDLHSVYNVIGRPAQSGSFAEVYGRHRERH